MPQACMLPDAGHKSPHPMSSPLQSVGCLGLMDTQGLLLGLLPPQTWQDQSILQGTIALRQVPPCCSSHTEELTPQNLLGRLPKSVSSPRPACRPILTCPLLGPEHPSQNGIRPTFHPPWMLPASFLWDMYTPARPGVGCTGLSSAPGAALGSRTVPKGLPTSLPMHWPGPGEWRDPIERVWVRIAPGVGRRGENGMEGDFLLTLSWVWHH